MYHDPFAIGYAGARDSDWPGWPRGRARTSCPRRGRSSFAAATETSVGFELPDAAARPGSPPRRSRLSTRGAAHYVDFIGFTPGLPYLSGLPGPCISPPRATASQDAAGQCSASVVACSAASTRWRAQGFWVLGRTPVPLYDPTAVVLPPAARAGDTRALPPDRPDRVRRDHRRGRRGELLHPVVEEAAAGSGGMRYRSGTCDRSAVRLSADVGPALASPSRRLTL